MSRKMVVPNYGPLTGVRVLITGSLIAMPHAATMLADFGAEVITYEKKDIGETYRPFPPLIKNENGIVGAAFAQESRNRLNVTFEMNLTDNPEAKEVFAGLIRESDIFMENMVWMDKFSITDEWLLEINPKLVIVHVSGYGNKRFGGVEELCKRASNDAVGQAYSGTLSFNGTSEEPYLVKPFNNDYITALTAAFGALSAYIHAEKTGEGQIVDVTQFEAQARVMNDLFVNYTELGLIKKPAPYPIQPAGIFMTKDKFVSLALLGKSQFYKGLEIFGFDPEYFTFEEVAFGPSLFSEKGKEFDQKFREWCKNHTAEEIVKVFATKKIPCAQINNAEDCYKEKHWHERGNFINYEDQTLRKEITAFGIVPKMSKTPGKVWRGAPRLGQDNEVVLKEILGYSEEKIAKLKEKGVY
jgi:crotonobetainyl-CoA:carnitine CoA-transferase CaiB-like acyl-CoA transferase